MRGRAAAVKVFGAAFAAMLLTVPLSGTAGAVQAAAPPQNLRLSVTPRSGPPGTQITVKSVDPCPKIGGVASQAVVVTFIYHTLGDAIPSTSVHAAVAPDGSWTVKQNVGELPFRVPGPGVVLASCSAPGVQGLASYSEAPFDVTTTGAGYWLVSATPVPAVCFCTLTSNMLFAGDASDYGPRPAHTGAPLVGIAPNPLTGTGYWLAASDGGVFSFGDARFHGSAGALRLTRPVVGITATPTGHGYWLVASDGGVFAFGDARFFGSTGGLRLARPIVGMAPMPSGHGYWLVASDGGVFAFGDARFFGSTGALRLKAPVVGIAATPSGHGYWLAASDGGVFTFGDAGFFGSAARPGSVSSVVGIAATASGHGYWLAMSSGAVFAFGDTPAITGCVEGCGTNAVVAIARTPVTSARN